MFYDRECNNVPGLYWAAQHQFAGRSYAASETRATWLDAADRCSADNATLAVITTADQDEFLRHAFTDDFEM